jgi:hypothetical protein
MEPSAVTQEMVMAVLAVLICIGCVFGGRALVVVDPRSGRFSGYRARKRRAETELQASQTFSGPVYDRLAALSRPHESPVDSVLPEIRYASAAEASLTKGHHRRQPAQHETDGLNLG